MRIAILSVFAVASMLLTNGVKADAQNINVVINGQPVAFIGTPPQEQNGSVLVPLRGVFEQLGAQVQYNPTSQTIFASKGTTTVSLSLGSSTAYVNNQPQQLAQPPVVVVGTTLVPLRFVAEAFGAYVEWQPQTSTVVIQTGPSGAVPIGPPPPVSYPGHEHDQLTTISGRITGLGNSTFTVGADSGPVQMTLDFHTKVTVREHGQAPIPSAPEALHDGEFVTAQIWPNGNARSVEIESNHDKQHAIDGRIFSIDNVNDPRFFIVNSPSGPVQLGIDSNTSVVVHHPDGATHPATTALLRVGDEVSVQTLPNGIARIIQINFDEHRGRVVQVNTLPDGDFQLVLDNGETVIVDQHVRPMREHRDLARPVQPGDSISIRLRIGGQSGYSLDVF